MLKVCLVKTSVSSVTAARQLARDLIERRLAACVHISDPGASLYRWQGELESEAEQLLTIKTTLGARGDVIAYLKANHPYELPEIIWQAFETTEDYGNWVDSEVDTSHRGNE